MKIITGTIYPLPMYVKCYLPHLILSITQWGNVMSIKQMRKLSLEKAGKLFKVTQLEGFKAAIQTQVCLTSKILC